MNEQVLGRYLRERLTALPDGQPLLILTLAEELGERFFPALPRADRTAYCGRRISPYFRGQFCRKKWGWRESTLLIKRGSVYGLALVWWSRLALAEELGTKPGC